MMSSGGGSITLCSSSIAHRGTANHDALAAAKGAVSSLALSAASTYSPHNIRVNVCVPGVVRADLPDYEVAADPYERAQPFRASVQIDQRSGHYITASYYAATDSK